MNKQLIATTSKAINVPVSKVWDALVNPATIKQYLYGTQTESEWKVGSPIFFRGEWEGKAYEDKGEILELMPEHKLQYSYLSSFSNLPDTPDNYSVVTFELKADGDKTNIAVSQSNFPDETSRSHSEANWKQVLSSLKTLLEQ